MQEDIYAAMHQEMKLQCVSDVKTPLVYIFIATISGYYCIFAIFDVKIPLISTFSLTILVIQGLYFGGSAVVNHGIVTLDQITNTASTALLCVTPAADCCTLAGSGDWFSPSGSVITTSTSSATYQVKGSFFVDLRRSSGGVEGIYRCDIRLSAGAARTSFYVGLYLAGSGIQKTL